MNNIYIYIFVGWNRPNHLPLDLLGNWGEGVQAKNKIIFWICVSDSKCTVYILTACFTCWGLRWSNSSSFSYQNIANLLLNCSGQIVIKMKVKIYSPIIVCNKLRPNFTWIFTLANLRSLLIKVTLLVILSTYCFIMPTLFTFTTQW